MEDSSQELKHRSTSAPKSTPRAEEEEEEEEVKKLGSGYDEMKKKKSAMAKRGLRSLGLAVVLPLSLTVLDISLFGSNLEYATMKKSFWNPPLWALHLACLLSAFFMGLSGWLVWAKGGFHRQPWALLLYLSQMALGLAWDPIVFRAGAGKVGLCLCVALFGVLLGCIRMFRNVSPIAGDLVKPCLLWPCLLSLVNFKLV